MTIKLITGVSAFAFAMAVGSGAMANPKIEFSDGNDTDVNAFADINRGEDSFVGNDAYNYTESFNTVTEGIAYKNLTAYVTSVTFTAGDGFGGNGGSADGFGGTADGNGGAGGGAGGNANANGTGGTAWGQGGDASATGGVGGSIYSGAIDMAGAGTNVAGAVNVGANTGLAAVQVLDNVIGVGAGGINIGD